MEGKAVYNDFNQEQIVEVEWNSDDGLVIYRGWDFGYHHPAVHFSCLNSSDQWIWLWEEMGDDIELGKFVEHILDVTEAKFPKCSVRDFVPHDAVNVKDISTEKEERSCLDVLQNANIMGEVTRSDVMSGINLIRQKMLLRQDGKFGMLVNRDMKMCIEGLLGGYHRNPKPEKGDQPVKDGYFEHLMDAARMTAVNIFMPGRTQSRGEVKIEEPDYIYDELTGSIIA